ncbi:hypothetical protein CRM22_002145 [Opisthorchis felineus]|uniref:Protein with SprT-like domain at the N terminus n=1 Tax=Opisthorchis felineus TaxID=147828 RepID=A0A4S2MDS6_OPIFE|nr:hypothetical protein CRM22_002145 [Opisthorchis felineus]
MWSDTEVEKIIQVFPEALYSDHIIPRPLENTYTQGLRGKSGRHVNTVVPRDDQKMSKTDMSLVDPMWELIDPAPDVRALFLQFNSTFFDGKLGSVEVRWSPRMTLCAGLCCYEGRGGLCSIRLSEPLLKLRPRSDLVETLLHEMIHAFLFVTQNDRDREGHGPNFQFHMRRINALAGTRITIYHTFHDEVANYQNHWWRCTGPCQQRPPFFGYVKRAMNRAPGPNDTWWSQHQATCSGRFVKIKEPEKSNKSTTRKRDIKGQATSLSAPTKKPYSDIRTFLAMSTGEPSSSKSEVAVGSAASQKLSSSDRHSPDSSKYRWPEPDRGHILGGNRAPGFSSLLDSTTTSKPLQPREPSPINSILSTPNTADPDQPVFCPVCSVSVTFSEINEHLDLCISTGRDL